MPGSGFFRSLGLCVIDGFLGLDACGAIRSEMASAVLEKGLIGRGDREKILDESVRRVASASLAAATAGDVKEQILAIRPKLAQHFGDELGDCEPPEFLLYETGSFFLPHRDVGNCERSEASSRHVSLVIFLNGSSCVAAPDSYGGGALTFYGLMTGTHWEKCAFELEASPGLLVAFPSSLLHEVRRVEFGRRFTITSWFHSKTGRVRLRGNG